MKQNYHTALTDKLTGRALAMYCQTDHPSHDFRDCTKLLIYAVGGIDVAGKYLEKLFKNDLSLVTFYPAFDGKDKIKGMEKIDTIPDGCLYMG